MEFVQNTYVDYYGTIWTLYIVAALPVFGYTLIYIGIRNHYSKVTNKNQGILCKKEFKNINLAISTTLFFFIAIGQAVLDLQDLQQPGKIHGSLR